MKNFIQLLLLLLPMISFSVRAQGGSDEQPEKLYLIGAITMSGSSAPYTFTGFEFVNEDSLLVCRNVDFHESLNGYAEFAIVEKQGQDNFNNNISYASRFDVDWIFNDAIFLQKTATQVSGATQLMMITPGTYDVYLDFSSSTSAMLTISQAGSTVEEMMKSIMPSPLYLIGGVKTDEFTGGIGLYNYTGKEFEYQDGNLVCDKVALYRTESYGDYSLVAIKQDIGESNWSTGLSLNIAASSTPLNLEEGYALTSARNSPGTMLITPGYYDFTINYGSFSYNTDVRSRKPELIVTVATDSIETGVHVVPDPVTPVVTEYFTLQGVKVERPTCGLYIARRGAHAELIVIKSF